MKDFTLSEIKTKCTGNCFKCDERNEELSKFCRRFIKTHDDREMPRDWDIEPRDMVELPCKQRVIMVGKEWWFVYSRIENGFIANQAFDLEEQADEFLQELKNGKV